MQFTLVQVLACTAAVALATPVALTEGLLRARELHPGWRMATAEDIALMNRTGAYSSDRTGVKLPGGLSKGGSGLAKRQAEAPGQYITNQNLVGDGSPHQNPFHQQQTATLSCDPSNSCSVSSGASHSIMWSTTAGVSYEFFSGSFSVGESDTTSQTYTCNAPAGGEVCVWYTYPQTAYTVTATTCYYYDGSPSMCSTSDPYVNTAPNTCNGGSTPYCVNGGACRQDNSGYVDNGPDQPAGGPPC